MNAILKREVGAYFKSPIGFVVLAFFNVFSGMFFYMSCLMSDNSDLTPVFSSMLLIIIFLVPIMTMKLLSEEKKQKTDQMLLTAPISVTKIILGKYLSACIMLLICFSIFFVYALVIAAFTPPAWNMIICTFIGLYLAGAAIIAVGLFISSLTESQVIAAVGGFAAGLFIYMVDSIVYVVPQGIISDIVGSLSFIQHLSNFSIGLFNISDIIFFLSVTVLFLFLTVRAIEKKRWS